MPVDVEELVRAVSLLADKNDLRVTVKQSGKGAAVCGAMCFIGGLIAGPVGLALGGTLGGVTAYRMSGQFRSVGDIINNDMTVEEKWRLQEHIVNSVRNVHAGDAAAYEYSITARSSFESSSNLHNE